MCDITAHLFECLFGFASGSIVTLVWMRSVIRRQNAHDRWIESIRDDQIHLRGQFGDLLRVLKGEAPNRPNEPSRN